MAVLQIKPRSEQVLAVSEVLKNLGRLQRIDPERGGRVPLLYETNDVPAFKEAALVQGLQVEEVTL